MENNGLHFFKILLNSDIQEGKVRMPRKFMKEHGNSLSSPVILKVPSDETWEVELSKSDDDVWLDKGWKEFADFYSLEHGSFLVFGYEGDCRFSMKICAKGDMEIAYPSSQASASRQRAARKRSHDDHEDQSKNVRNANVGDEYKDKRKNDVSKLASTSTRGIKETIAKKRGRPKSNRQPEKPQVSATKTARFAQGDKAEKRSKIESKHPFLEIVLKDYHRFSLVISKGFAISSGLINMRKTFIQDPARRQWPVFVNIMNTNQLRMSAGWSNFYQANRLAVGDTLVLHSELGSGQLIIAQVHKCR